MQEDLLPLPFLPVVNQSYAIIRDMRKEGNPMGIPEAEYAAKRQALLDMLKDDPQRAAVFMLLENMWELEQTPGETHHEIGWEHGNTTSDYLLSALDGYSYRIPVAEVYRGYTPFSWKIRKPVNSQEYEWYDMRINAWKK